jgi:hypothetical protein
MINLLPPQEKEHLAFEEHKRMVIILSSVTAVALVCLALLLAWVKVTVLKAALAEESISQSYQQEYRKPMYTTIKDTIVRANTTLTQAENFYAKQISLSDALYIVSEISKPVGIHVMRLDEEQNHDKGSISVTMSGTSATRDDLLTFRSAMNNFSWGSKKILQNVYFPPESWTKPKDISFQITFQINAAEIKR